ncbi:MAG: PIN domain-containing protein [Proteobacteria bacterium]|nr:PIN domain-containing protein [Pseudomonadota bacterium]
MIHFDTNALVALPLWAQQGHPAISRVLAGEAAAASAVVWYEFLSGPLATEEVRLARAFLQGRILPITEDDAEVAARLFNAAGRKRKLKTDALIAAVALRAGAEFVTLNATDFMPFVAQGLRLVTAP